MVGKRSVALKYCGGCNPTFDRPAYVRKIKSAAGALIEWTTLPQEWEKILFIQGCPAACLEKYFGSLKQEKVLSIKNNDRDPKEIVEKLLSEGK
jgi:hypothetical protein